MPALLTALEQYGDEAVFREAKSQYYASSMMHMPAEAGVTGDYTFDHTKISFQVIQLKKAKEYTQFLEDADRLSVSLASLYLFISWANMNILCSSVEPETHAGDGRDMDMFLDKLFEQCDNVAEVTLNFKGLDIDSSLGIEQVVRDFVLALHDSRKMSAVFGEGRSQPEQQPLGRIETALRQENQSARGPYKARQSSVLRVFERYDVASITKALNLSPKLGSIRGCTDRIYLDHYDPEVEMPCFMVYLADNREEFEVVWFWEAEAGQTLSKYFPHWLL